MATTQRTGVPSLQQLKLAYILSVVPANATHDEFQAIKRTHDPLFDAAIEREYAKAYQAAKATLEAAASIDRADGGPDGDSDD